MSGGKGGGGGGGGGGGSKWDMGPPMKKRKGQAACWFFVRRIPCGYGNECTFSHDPKFCETAAGDDPDLATWKTELCPHAEKKKNGLMSEKKRKLVAYHEAGHAIVGALLPEYD